jgi:hypothetical protein
VLKTLLNKMKSFLKSNKQNDWGFDAPPPESANALDSTLHVLGAEPMTHGSTLVLGNINGSLKHTVAFGKLNIKQIYGIAQNYRILQSASAFVSA